MDDRIVTPGSRISPGTHVGVAFERKPVGVTAAPSTPDPGALVEHNRVSTGHELEITPETGSEADSEAAPETGSETGSATDPEAVSETDPETD